MITENQEKMRLPAKFKPPTYGYDRVASRSVETGRALPEDLARKLMDILSLEEGPWQEASEQLTDKTALAISGEAHMQEEPVLFDIRAELTSDEAGLEIDWLLNPLAKPLVYSLEDNPSYQEAEALTDDDSSLYGIAAALAAEPKDRGRLYSLMARMVCKAIVDLENLTDRIESVYLGEGLTPAFVMTSLHGRDDLFPGFKVDGNLNSIYDGQTLDDWANIWKEKASEISSQLSAGEALSLDDVKFVEVLSHLFNNKMSLLSLGYEAQKQSLLRQEAAQPQPEPDSGQEAAAEKLTPHQKEINKIDREIERLEQRLEQAGILDKRRIKQKIIDLKAVRYEKTMRDRARRSRRPKPAPSVEKYLERKR